MRTLLIVSAAQKDTANAWWKQNIDVHGDAFTVPLNASGDVKDGASHYWAACQLTNDQKDAVNEQGWTVNDYDEFANPTFPQDTLTSLGLSTLSSPI